MFEFGFVQFGSNSADEGVAEDYHGGNGFADGGDLADDCGDQASRAPFCGGALRGGVALAGGVSTEGGCGAGTGGGYPVGREWQGGFERRARRGGGGVCGGWRKNFGGGAWDDGFGPVCV